ncbi:uncharacterized protein BDV17DRAFT_251709 [Aspergillus undulatus]|uniref:uncharacterized protein n=1 Tax=Aspergillus undulatus TaxID=1810928 RepID=UPI003CCDA69D
MQTEFINTTTTTTTIQQENQACSQNVFHPTRPPLLHRQSEPPPIFLPLPLANPVPNRPTRRLRIHRLAALPRRKLHKQPRRPRQNPTREPSRIEETRRPTLENNG